MNLIPLTELAANGVTIRINRIETPKGERLEIETPSSSVRLDAVALEALTWQENDTLATLPDANATTTTSLSTKRDDKPEKTRLTSVSNEFGFVVVYEFRTETDVWIEIEARKQGESIRLCHTELNTLAQQDQDVFTRWIRADLNE